MNSKDHSLEPLQVEFYFKKKGQIIEVFLLNDSSKEYEFSHDINPN